MGNGSDNFLETYFIIFMGTHRIKHKYIRFIFIFRFLQAQNEQIPGK